jgi:hypothetical protein
MADNLNYGAATSLIGELSVRLACPLLLLHKEAAGEITESTRANVRSQTGHVAARALTARAAEVKEGRRPAHGSAPCP